LAQRLVFVPRNFPIIGGPYPEITGGWCGARDGIIVGMELRKEVVERLLLAKSLLAKMRFHSVSEPDSKFLAGHIMTAHDAAELVLAAIGDQLGVLPPKDKHYLMDYFGPLKKLHPDHEVYAKEYFSQLNRVRVNIKHYGIFPDPRQWARVGETSYSYISKWCSDYLGTALQMLDESTLLSSAEVKKFFHESQSAISAGDFKGALELLAMALFTLFWENAALRGLEVGRAKPEDAIRLSGFGVHGNDFLALQEFLPECVRTEDGALTTKWQRSKFGHPGNWRDNAAHFCADTFLDVALKIQDASWIPGAIHYLSLYEQKLVASRDGVEIWVKKPEPGANTMEQLLGTKTRREVVRTLAEGESLRGTVTIAKDPSSYILAPERVTPEAPDTYMIASRDPTPLFGYVLAEDVRVTSVPRDTEFVRKYFSWLPETEWAPDER
jgi:hypothetical protein